MATPSSRPMCSPMWKLTATPITTPTFQVKSGDALYLTDKKTGELTKVTVLVCVMPYSELPFLMALPNATTEWFFHGLNKGLEYMGALPRIAKSNNMRQWVSKSDRYSPSLSDACMEWGLYYGIQPTA